MPRFKADLHIHSCLSPCGDLSMGPFNIVEYAKKNALDIIALTDHNSALNTAALMPLCKKAGITLIPGLEICTQEEVHILALFPTIEKALLMDKVCTENLVKIPNNPEKTGDQILVNKKEEITGEYPWYLLSSTNLSLKETTEEIHKLGGLAIPSHIDRPTFSCYSQLGFLPEEDFDAVEVYNNPSQLDTKGYTIIKNSDAHFPEDIARRHFFLEAEQPDFYGIKEALVKARVTTYPFP
ncbi:PHP domain-containing protein [Spirochaetia bacterium 38H-sp]|uniref:PHP domain-containing protein n=1 Tax=Rarispira pelagica TaxID=3141764 RepID=A0ABU9UCQ8_9SPIR